MNPKSLVCPAIFAAALCCNASPASALDWTRTTVDNSADVTGLTPDMCLDDNGVPHIVYWEDVPATTRDFIRYARWNGTSWDTTEVGQGHYPSLAVDGNGRPHIFSASSFSISSINHDTYGENGWQRQYVGSLYGQYSSAAIGPDGRPSFCTSGSHNSGIYYGHYDGTAWNIEEVWENTHAGWTSMTFDDSGRPHLAWVNPDGPRNLYYAFWDGLAWQHRTVTGCGYSYNVSIAVDGEGLPHIAFFRQGSDDLLYAVYDGTDWDILTLASEGDVGKGVSLELDGDDDPHISYFDLTNTNLMYTRLEEGQWITEVVDYQAGTGGRSSLELGANDIPYIAYYESGMGRLRFAVAPEPATVALLGLGAVGLLLKRRRKS